MVCGIRVWKALSGNYSGCGVCVVVGYVLPGYDYLSWIRSWCVGLVLFPCFVLV